MEMKLTRRHTEGISIMDLGGRITSGDFLAVFREAIRDEVAKGNNKILINLEQVSYIDSSGLGELVLALGTVTQTICGSCGATLFRDDDGQWEPCPQCNGNSRTTWGQ